MSPGREVSRVLPLKQLPRPAWPPWSTMTASMPLPRNTLSVIVLFSANQKVSPSGMNEIATPPLRLFSIRFRLTRLLLAPGSTMPTP